MSHRLVLDASASLEAVLGRPQAAAVLDRVERATVVRAPDLYGAEVANALWKHVKAGDLDLSQALTALQAALDIVDATIPSADLAEEALATAAAFDHPVDDALYLVAARRSGATICTRDRRLAELAAATRVPVEVV
ncbi:MAG: type II toxin-antitoxin system VapC family toxin [Thermoanaerobaculales bacterium]|jgi:predicted nucleic acid-binding protein|nr:type II toxin-antitoxin system VapC family toxin [Thermoanaerobaculales bacterium]